MISVNINLSIKTEANIHFLNILDVLVKVLKLLFLTQKTYYYATN